MRRHRRVRRQLQSDEPPRQNEGERFKAFSDEDLTKRNKENLDIFWLKDEALQQSANRSPSGVIASDLVDDLEAALEQFAAIEAGFDS